MAVIVGVFKLGETHITISGLLPHTFYSIRVRVTSASGTISTSLPFQVQTNRSSEVTGEALSSDHTRPPASVRGTSTPATILPASFTREGSGSIGQRKRTASCRHNSPPASGSERPSTQAYEDNFSDDDESPEAIKILTERLESLRAEKERVDNETTDEEEEVKRQLAELTRDRDRFKQELKEKEDTNSELRKHGNHLDRICRAAQSRKSVKEKQLQQKKAERQKLLDDTERWISEIGDMKRDTAEMVEETDRIATASGEELAELRKSIDENQAVIRSLEEEIRMKGSQIKDLEKEQDKIASEDNDASARARSEQQNVQIWEVKMQDLHVQFAALWQTVHQSELEKQRVDADLAWWTEKQAMYPEQFAPTPALEAIPFVHRTRSRRNRQSNSRTSTISSPSNNHQVGATPFNNTSAMSQPFPTPSPIYNVGNGTSTGPGTDIIGSSQAEAELNAGDGSMGIVADDLLPANLFRDEDSSIQRSYNGYGQEPPGIVNPTFPSGHANTNSDASAYGPRTPGSVSSRANSIFPSPHDSLPNLHGYQSRQDQYVDGDQHSLNSSSTPFNPSVAAESNPLLHSRISSLFTPFKHRKLSANDPPLLGTLRQGQSQSFPRDLEDNVDSSSSRRRRGSYGNWANPVVGLLNRNTSDSRDSGLITARTGSGRRSRLNMFGGRFDNSDPSANADQPSSSRPSSTYSHDPVLGRPSSDSQRFGWALSDGIPSRSSPLGANWATGPWSRAPSRRPSVQHGSTSNLSVGSTPLEADGYPGAFSKPSSDLAPIGTRPKSSQQHVTPKLNPTAPSFKTLFVPKKGGKGDKSGGRGIEKSKDKETEKAGFDDIDPVEETSPPISRRSRDAQSITTAASVAESHDSFDRSTSGTPSEAATPSGPKETLMQKISRKSSSSKFNVPWSKERGLFSKRAGESSTPGEVDEDAPSEGYLGKSAESTSSTPQQEKLGRTSISYFRRKSKKGEQALNEPAERDADGDIDIF